MHVSNHTIVKPKEYQKCIYVDTAGIERNLPGRSGGEDVISPDRVRDMGGTPKSAGLYTLMPVISSIIFQRLQL